MSEIHRVVSQRKSPSVERIDLNLTLFQERERAGEKERERREKNKRARQKDRANNVDRLESMMRLIGGNEDEWA